MLLHDVIGVRYRKRARHVADACSVDAARTLAGDCLIASDVGLALESQRKSTEKLRRVHLASCWSEGAIPSVVDCTVG